MPEFTIADSDGDDKLTIADIKAALEDPKTRERTLRLLNGDEQGFRALTEREARRLAKGKSISPKHPRMESVLQEIEQSEKADAKRRLTQPMTEDKNGKSVPLKAFKSQLEDTLAQLAQEFQTEFSALFSNSEEFPNGVEIDSAGIYNLAKLYKKTTGSPNPNEITH